MTDIDGKYVVDVTPGDHQLKVSMDAYEARTITVTTGAAPHRIEGLLSIDHIAVPSTWVVRSCRRIPASDGDRRLSDHDAYVIEVGIPA